MIKNEKNIKAPNTRISFQQKNRMILGLGQVTTIHRILAHRQVKADR